VDRHRPQGEDGGEAGIVEIPRAGGAPVVVDTFPPSDVGYYTNAIDPGDGYLYYDADPAGGATGTLSLRRVPMTSLGAPASVLGTAPMSRWNVTFAADGDGYLYFAAEWGIARVPTAGGALEVLTSAVPPGYEQPNAIAVGGGFVYFGIPSYGCLPPVTGRVPVTGGNAVPFAFAEGPVAFGGTPAELFVAVGTHLEQVDPNAGLPQTIFTTHVGVLGGMSFVGSRLYLTDACPSPAPCAGPGGVFHPWYDTATGVTGYLEQDPGYPFVPGPTGFAHDASGDTLYYVE
jgi:hypothetical protein